MIPRPANILINALLFEYHDNSGHPSYRRLMVSLLKHYWWDKMTLEYKLYCQHRVICNRAKSDRRGGASLQPLEIPKYPIIMACHLTKMDHFVPCHKEITTEDSTYLFISSCYRLHGVPKLVVSDRYPNFV